MHFFPPTCSLVMVFLYSNRNPKTSWYQCSRVLLQQTTSCLDEDCGRTLKFLLSGHGVVLP